MKHGAFRKKLALVLAMSVILALGLPAAFAEEPQITGISVDLSEDGTLVAALGQNVDVKADEAKATITVAGGTSTGDEAYLRPEVTSVTVEVNHDVSDPSGNGFSYDISGLPANPEVAVYANQSNAENAPQVTVNMNGNDVSVGSAGTAVGVYANGQNVAVNAAGDVSASVSTAPADTDNTTAQAIITDSGATVKADSVQAEGYEAAAVSANGGSHVEAGSATATGVITATAVDANSRSDVKVETAVAETKEDNNDSTATAINAASGSTVTADNATATSTDGTAIAVSVTTSGSENPTTVIINEDASSSDIGVRVDGSGDEDKAVVEVGGTLNVDEGGTPVLLGSGMTEDNIEITVWKVEIDGEQAKEGEIVKTASENPTEEQTAAAKAVEESIQYIIKIDPSQTKNIQSSADKASANDTITVTITPPEGKKLDAVYSDEGKKIEATENEDGTYSVTVRAGGGMYLSAEFSEKPVDPTPDPTPDPEPKPEPKPIPVPVPLPSNIGIAPANDWATATVRLEPEHGAYTLYLTKRVPTMTFLRQTLEKFAKYNDKLIINTPYGNCEISISELLNFNQKAVNFCIVVTGTALEFYVNGELFRSIPLSDLT